MLFLVGGKVQLVYRRLREQPSLDLAGSLRCSLALLCVLAAVSEGWAVAALPWAVAVVAIEVTAAHLRTPAQRLPALVAEVAVVTAAIVTTYPDRRALLPLLLVPAFRAGQLHGMAFGVATGAVLAVVPLAPVALTPGTTGIVTGTQWSALALGLAVLGAWNARLEHERGQPSTLLAREAGHLLGRLQDLARALPAGFDVPAISEMLLEDVLAAAPADRAAVLVHVGPEEVSPVAVRGVERVPWRDPVRSPGTAHRAWTTRSSVQDVRATEANGRRQGSAMLAVPIADRDDELLGLLVLERLGNRSFRRDEVEAVEHLVGTAAARLHAALAFVELRSLSEVAERERLAREMHDGVAQDLVVVGFGVDAVERQLRTREPALARQLQDVRGHLNATVRDIRYSIAELRSSVRSEAGLGAALSSAAHSLGPAAGVEVTFALKESAFRLPAHAESALLRLAQDFFGTVRSTGEATSVHVELEIVAPVARLELRHDGLRPWEPEPLFTTALTELGGMVRSWQEHGQWVSVMLLGVRDEQRPEEPAHGGDQRRPRPLEVARA